MGILQKTKRVFTRAYFKSGRLLGTGQDGNRDQIIILAAICMDGSYLPPSIIYQALSGNLQDTWLEGFNLKKDEAYFTSSPTGWTNDDIGYS